MTVVAPLVASARRAPEAALASVVLATVVLVAVAGQLLTGHDPVATDFASTMAPPSLAHPMGTDALGRDVLARFAAGARLSLVIGLFVVVVGATTGTAIGLVAGLARGVVDEILMRAMDAVLAFPSLLLAMAVTVGLGPGLTTATIGVTLGSIPWFARIARSETIRLGALPMVEAAVALGAGRWWLITRHILPNMVSTMVIQGTSAYGAAILSVAALGFLGLGAQIPTPEWGAMITDGLESTLVGAWWTTFFPGLGVLLVVGSTNLLADRLRDVLDPRGDDQRSG